MKRGVAAVVLMLAVGSGGDQVFAQSSGASGLKDEGVGLYTDFSVASQTSVFSINRYSVTCGVGLTQAGELVGPFDMIMYSLSVDSYNVDRATKTITAKGRMRSITGNGSAGVLEDAEHDYVAIAGDGGADGSGDRFDTHFKTAMWNTSNPMCTPSAVVEGGCRFGGPVLRGDVTVKAQQ